MASDYEKIRNENIEEYGKGTRHLSFLGRLYTDRTHFIFELLQNAEDAGASRIFFKLFEDRLEVSHDGRIFDERDVRGVCGVGEGTKAEDFTQIGKFGIGFKSVYAYTFNPEIHSGDENFRIEQYIRPYPAESQNPESPFTTLFIFTFNRDEVNAKTACDEIGSRLRNLNARTLLFLRKIDEIEYKLPDQTGGIYMRETKPRGIARQVTVMGQNNGKEDNQEWLIFERPVHIPDKSAEVKVEIAFQIETNTKKSIEAIKKISSSPLVVYFPTDKETRFGFLIQGPYRTTPSRDNIPQNDDWNKTLITETAQLLADTLLELKKIGLLTVTALQALPIRMSDFPPDGMFFSIVDFVRKTFASKDLLPADNGRFISAQTAKLARGADLRDLLKQEQLSLLFQPNDMLNWLTGEITQDRTPDLHAYILKELHVDEVTPDSFARKITESFLVEQSDSWIVNFYEYLSDHKDLWKSSRWQGDGEGVLRLKPIIRLQSGEHTEPFDGNDAKAYLPSESIANTTLPVVKTLIAKNKGAWQFLKDLGLPEFDITEEVIRHIIPKYSLSSPIVPFEEHKRDIDKILQAYKTDSQEKKQRLKKVLQETTFIFTKTLDLSEAVYRKPSDVYFPNEDLKMYFSGNSTLGFVSSDSDKAILDMFTELGVSEVVRVSKKTSNHNGYITISNWHGNHQRGLNGFDPYIKVDGLEHAIAFPSLEKSTFIWNSIAIPNHSCIRGTVESSSRQTYENPRSYEDVSNVGRLLIENSWLPGPNGDFQKPSELGLEDLPEQFERNDKLAELLGMKKDVVATLAQEAGLQADDIEMIRQNPEEFKQWKTTLTAQKEKTIFPTSPVGNPEHRQERVAERINNSPTKTYEPREISTRISRGEINPSVWLKNEYTNESGQMVCQICEEEMPFKKRDGEYYFEAVEALSNDYFSIECEEQFLALCPLCAAMYKEFVKRDELTMEDLSVTIRNSDNLEIPLKLGEWKTSIRFVESHWLDIKTILQSSE
jgi:hypothetical protein